MVSRAAETSASIRNYAQGTAGPQHVLIKSNHTLLLLILLIKMMGSQLVDI